MLEAYFKYIEKLPIIYLHLMYGVVIVLLIIKIAIMDDDIDELRKKQK